MAFSANSKTVFNYVKECEAEKRDVTASDIAEGTGLTTATVNGIVTSAFQRKGYMQRIPAEIELEDGSHKPIKLIKLTDEGKELDIDAAE